MYQIDIQSAVASPPASTAAGTPGYFTDGDPATGQEATILPAEFLNAWMREFLNVLAAANITPNKAAFNQLVTAIESLIESRSGNYVLDTGAANAYVVALSPVIASYAGQNGLPVKFRATHANTGASTLNAGGGAVPLLREDGAAVQAGDVPLNGVVSCTYDSTANAFLINSIVPSQLGVLAKMGIGAGVINDGSGNLAVSRTWCYALDTGAANAYAVTYSTAVTALIDGMTLKFQANNANTGAATFSPNGLTARPIVGGAHAALQGGEIVVGGEVELMWHALLNSWVLLGCTGGAVQVGNATQSQHAVPLSQVQMLVASQTPFSYFMGQL